MKKILLIFSFLLPVLIFAADESVPKDIIPRTLNFILFVALLYYFVANPVRDFFVGRAKGIADECDKVQNNLRESKKKLQSAQQGIDVASRQAEEIVSGAKREAIIMKQKIEENALREIEIMVKQYNDSLKFENRRMEQAVIQEILKELFRSDALNLDKTAYAEILLKKVA